MSEPATTAHLIRVLSGQAQIVNDSWRQITSVAQWDEAADTSSAQAANDGPVGLLVPLELALAQPGRLELHNPVGIWLTPADDPARAVGLFPNISLIGIQFPVFTDGRGYSTAVLLRTRLGWRGELRALGDILQDQLFALRRVGFDSFALRADRDPVTALRGFAAFSDVYQGSADQPLPAFRRNGTYA